MRRCAMLAVVATAVVAARVTLYFTVLRGRSPQVTAATAVGTGPYKFRTIPPEHNLSLAVGVTLRNPNHARFRHGEVFTTVTYRGNRVGQSTAPAGSIAALSTATLGAKMQVDAKKVILNKLYVLDVLAGSLPFQTATAVAGRAAVLRPLRVSAAYQVACSVVVYPYRRESSSRCTSAVHVT